MNLQNLVNSPLPNAVSFAFVQQLIVFAVIPMDGGLELGLICALAFVAFWGAAGLLLARRRFALNRLDTLLIRWSFIPLCIGTFFLVDWIESFAAN